MSSKRAMTPRKTSFISKLACFSSSPRKKKKKKMMTSVIVEPHLRSLFDSVDVDKSGAIDKDELRYLLKKCTGSLPTDAEVEAMMKDIDSDKNGVVDFEEFALIHERARNGDLPFAELSKVMVEFDKLSSSISDDPVETKEEPVEAPAPSNKALPSVNSENPPDTDSPQSSPQAATSNWGSMIPPDEGSEDDDEEVLSARGGGGGEQTPASSKKASSLFARETDDDDDLLFTPSTGDDLNEGFGGCPASREEYEEGEDWRHQEDDDEVQEETAVVPF